MEKELKRITVTKSKLFIVLSKYIKNRSKELKHKFREIISFNVIWENGKTNILIGDVCYVLEGTYMINEISDFANNALLEAGCNGVVTHQWESISVIIFSKPTKDYMMLSRLIQKYCNKTLLWDDVRNESICRNPFKTSYLCHQSKLCNDAVDFVRKNRTSRDKLKCDVIQLTENEFIKRMLSLKVETKQGKVKSEKVFEVKDVCDE